jgi:hypothetical protein
MNSRPVRRHCSSGGEPTPGEAPRVSRLRRRASLAVAGAVVGVAVVAPMDAAAATLTVVRGHQLVTAVPGFAPRAVVELRLDRVVMAGTSRADRRGTVHVRIPAPPKVGRHRLLLVTYPP